MSTPRRYVFMGTMTAPQAVLVLCCSSYSLKTLRAVCSEPSRGVSSAVGKYLYPGPGRTVKDLLPGASGCCVPGPSRGPAGTTWPLCYFLVTSHRSLPKLLEQCSQDTVSLPRQPGNWLHPKWHIGLFLRRGHGKNGWAGGGLSSPRRGIKAAGWLTRW